MPTKWLICPFDGNLGRSSPTRIPDRSQQFSPFTDPNPPIPNQYQSTNTATGGCCSRCIGGLYQCTNQPHQQSFHPQLSAQRSHSEITQAVVGIVGNCCSRYCCRLCRRRNQVLRPKHILANKSLNILGFVRINIIDRASAQNAVDGRLSTKLIPVTAG